MATAGSITVDLLLKTGSFQTDAERSSKAMKKLQRDIDDAAKKIGAAFGAGVVGIAYLTKSAIDAQDHLNDLSKKTGIAVDTLGGIGFAAQQSGGDLESAAAAAGKLNKSLAEAAAGNKDAKEAFDVLGISVTDATGATKKADVVLAELADKFAGYADGPEKAALALRIFGKTGADIIPLLDEGGSSLLTNIEYFKRYSGVTVESAQKADEFNDTLTKLKLLGGAFVNQLTAEVLPLLQTLADRFLKAKEEGDGFRSGAEGIVTVLKGLTIAGAYVADTFGGVGREIGAIIAQGRLLTEAFSGASLLEKASPVLMLKRLSDAFNSTQFTAISDEVKADGARAKKELDEFVAKVLNPTLAKTTVGDYSHEGRGRTLKPPAPRLPGDTTKKEKEKEDPFLKRQREAALAAAQAYESFYQQQLQVTAGFEAEAESAREQAAVFGLSKDELHAFTQEQLLAKAATLDLLAIRTEDKDIGSAVAAEYRKQAAAIRETATARDFLNQKEHDLHFDATTGATQAVKDYLSEIEKAGDTSHKLVEDSLRGLEDSLTQALTSGNVKSIAKSFVDQILSEVYRLYVVKPLLASIFGGGSSGGLGSILSLIDTFASGFSVDTSGAGTPSPAVPGLPRGGAATGTNMVERDIVTLLHKGEAVVPKAYNPAAGGRPGIPSIKVEKVPADHDVAARQDPDGTLVLTMQRIARAEINRSARPGGAIRQGLRVQPPDRS